MGRTVGLYTLARIVLFAVCYAVLYAVGLRGLLAVLAALLISSVLSLFLLRGQRDQLAGALQRRAERKQTAKDELRAMLDEGPGSEDRAQREP